MFILRSLLNLLLWLFEKPHPLKSKIIKIKKDIILLVDKECDESFSILWYGAYNIDPKHLVYLVTVKSDDMKIRLRSNAKLNLDLRHLLTKHDYPENSRNSVIIDYESQETVDRESGGDWHLHLK